MLHISIGMLQLLGTIRIFLTLCFVLLTGSLREERIVKRDDATCGTIVGSQVTNLQLLLTIWELAVDGIEQSPIA